MYNNNSTMNRDSRDSSNSDPPLSKPPLQRERASDYGMFPEGFEYDVSNWFYHSDNIKRAKMIQELTGLMCTWQPPKPDSCTVFKPEEVFTSPLSRTMTSSTSTDEVFTPPTLSRMMTSVTSTDEVVTPPTLSRTMTSVTSRAEVVTPPPLSRTIPPPLSRTMSVRPVEECTIFTPPNIYDC